MGVFVYGVSPNANLSTNAVANTITDQVFIKPGATEVSLEWLQVIGKSTAVTALSGIEYRIVRWTTTSSSGGTAITPNITHSVRAPAALTTAGFASAGVTSGTGGPNTLFVIGSTATGPNQINFPEEKDQPFLEASANSSLDLESTSGAISLPYAVNLMIAES
jgi:hypothetical protein